MKKYSEEFDAYYDDEKNIWLEDKCPLITCEYCSKRPKTPKQIKGENK